ncbi:hypothetical protein O3P69_019916 [Scylla paramamosain]|uniref:Peptidase S1 domain-containing protein n=1 Tax=Scylla paramamosain TaxID=85552 RepID=A0AAW0SJS7_SCYPA
MQAALLTHTFSSYCQGEIKGQRSVSRAIGCFYFREICDTPQGGAVTLYPLGRWVSRSAYDSRELTSGMVCAGDLAGEIDTCTGDSGGPLVYDSPAPDTCGCLHSAGHVWMPAQCRTRVDVCTALDTYGCLHSAGHVWMPAQRRTRMDACTAPDTCGCLYSAEHVWMPAQCRTRVDACTVPDTCGCLHSARHVWMPVQRRTRVDACTAPDTCGCLYSAGHVWMPAQCRTRVDACTVPDTCGCLYSAGHVDASAGFSVTSVVQCCSVCV